MGCGRYSAGSAQSSTPAAPSNRGRHQTQRLSTGTLLRQLVKVRGGNACGYSGRGRKAGGQAGGHSAGEKTKPNVFIPPAQSKGSGAPGAYNRPQPQASLQTPPPQPPRRQTY